MASHDDNSDLPITWPFRAAGTILMGAIIWFLGGFAVEDAGEHLPSHLAISQLLVLIAVLLVVGGGIYNGTRERERRRRHQA